MSTYIGGRIIPKHAGTWDEQAEYEMLTIVLDEETGDSYISRKAVPASTALDDEEYWAKSSDYSVQLKNIQDAVDVLEAQVAANVTASTDADADYAAEVVDARIDADGNTHDSLGAHIRDVDERKVETTEDVTGELITGSMVNCNNGNEQTFSNTYCTEMIPVNRDCQKVYYTGQVFNYIGVCGYDSGGDFVTSILDTIDEGAVTKEYSKEELSIPEGVFYIRASSYMQEPVVLIETDFGDLADQAGDLDLRAGNLEEYTEEIDEKKLDRIIDATGEITTGVSVNTESGNLVTFSSGYTTDFIAVDAECQKVYYTGRVFNWVGVAGYDNDGNYVSSVLDLTEDASDAEYVEEELTIPDGVTKIRASSYTYAPVIKIAAVSGSFWERFCTVMARLDDAEDVLEEQAEQANEMTADINAKLDKVTGKNLLDPDAYRPGWFAYTGQSNVEYHSSNLAYGATNYIPVSENGLITSGSGTSGVTSQVIYDSNYNALRYVDSNDQYTYEDGDAFVVFCYHASSAEGLCIVEGTEYEFEEYTDYLPLQELSEKVDSLEEQVSDSQQDITALSAYTVFLSENAMSCMEVEMLYSSGNSWTNSSPLLSNYWTPLTVLQDVYIESVTWTQRFYGADTMTVTIEDEFGNVYFTEEVPIDVTIDEETTYGDMEITVTPSLYLSAGAYLIRYYTEDKIQCYTTKGSNDYLSNSYFSNEASGSITYLYNNTNLVFKGTIVIRISPDYTEEIEDARIDGDGNTYDTLGEHIRTIEETKLDSLYDATGEITTGVSVRTNSSGQLVTFSAGYTTDYIPVDPDTQVVYYTGRIFNWVGIAGYDGGKNFVAAVLDTTEDASVVDYEDEVLTLPEGTKYIRASSYTYAPVIRIKGTAEALWEHVLESEIRLDELENADKTDIGLSVPMPLYTVCNDINTDRNYYASVWIDHLIQEAGWTDTEAGFGDSMDQSFNLYAPFSSSYMNGGEDILEQTITMEFQSEKYSTQELSFTHRSTLASMGKSKFPKILVIGDSVTSGYLAGKNKADSSLPSPYWAWVKYLFELDRADAGGDTDDFNCLMVGVSSIDSISYGSSSSFTLNGTTFKCYAVGKGGWSAEDLNLETFESDTNLNPFYDEETEAFSLKAFLENFRTLDDDGVTRLVVGDTAGAKVEDATAYDLCTPTHVVINLNHNSSLSEYQETIPGIIETIKEEYPDMVIILMSIDETGTYFPERYPQYDASDITIGSLHEKNVSIYDYFCEELQDESNGIYVCSGHLVQPAVESYPSFVYTSADSIGRADEDVLGYFHGYGYSYGGPNWHPNNYAHAAWGYQLYALIKYTLAMEEIEESIDSGE